MEKEKVVYEAPTITVVELKMESGILAASGELDLTFGEEDF